MMATEDIGTVPYDERWPDLFLREKAHLLACLPAELIRRVEHFGSTAVPGLAAKPIIDILVEVASLQDTKLRIVPTLDNQGYQHFWSPEWGVRIPRRYVWFIKRDHQGVRTHHIHMVESDFWEHWDRLLFRDYLIANPGVAAEYGELKARLAKAHPHDRKAYTGGKTEFIDRVTEDARGFFECGKNSLSAAQVSL